MNKKLVALAVAGAFALPLAAEAQTAKVTLYGPCNMDLEFVKASGPGASDGSTSTVTRVASNSSRFGLRGTEALGGGLTAFFQVENSVAWDGNPNARRRQRQHDRQSRNLRRPAGQFRPGLAGSLAFAV